jgi:hypothetical protein
MFYEQGGVDVGDVDAKARRVLIKVSCVCTVLVAWLMTVARNVDWIDAYCRRVDQGAARTDLACPAGEHTCRVCLHR